MPHYMLIIVDDPNRSATPEEMGRDMAAMGEFGGRHSEKIVGGAPLHGIAQAVRVAADGEATLVTDGPFAETKEMVAGYFVLDVASLEEAVAIARDCPHTKIGTVEVREILPVGGPPV